MKPLSLNTRRIELLVYGTIWALVFSIPYFVEQNGPEIHWSKIGSEWIRLLFYLFVFVFTVHYLVPRLLFRKKYVLYFSFGITMILATAALEVAVQPGFPERGATDVGMPFEDFTPDAPIPPTKPPIMRLLDNVILSILIVGAGTAFGLVSKWLSEEQLRKDIEKEQIQTNLALLRNQVSPHLFMNTLNNIHALIDINTEDAKDAIIRLSTLMRYLLYDSAQGHIYLSKEIEFLNSFISLMRLRCSDNVDITVAVPEHIPNIQIPPMLFISFLDNAFKHGVSYQARSFIHVTIQIIERSLVCKIRNSKHAPVQPHGGEYFGIGLENSKRTLKLLYDEEYQLQIADGITDFEVNLTIPI